MESALKIAFRCAIHWSFVHIWNVFALGACNCLEFIQEDMISKLWMIIRCKCAYAWQNRHWMTVTLSRDNIKGGKLSGSFGYYCYIILLCTSSNSWFLVSSRWLIQYCFIFFVFVFVHWNVSSVMTPKPPPFVTINAIHFANSRFEFLNVFSSYVT